MTLVQDIQGAVKEGNVVLVQDTPQGTGVATPVRLGLSDGTYVEVVSGLIEGDRVLVEYQAAEDPFAAFMGGMPGGPGAFTVRGNNRMR